MSRGISPLAGCGWATNATVPLAEFIEAYKPENRNDREESERFRSYTYEELLQRDKVSMDIIWLRDESLEDSANLEGYRNADHSLDQE